MYELTFAYLLSFPFFIFVYMWFSYAAYFIFPIFWVLFEEILSKSDLDDLYKISFVKTSYSYDDMAVSVVLQVMS